MLRVSLALLIILIGPAIGHGETSKLFKPVEWSYQNPSCTGNPYDLIAEATFTHSQSGQKIKTELYYDRNDTWKLRFTGTKTGKWTFVTKSKDKDLNDLTGSVDIEPNPGVPGFITNFGNKWGRTGVDEAFVPQYVMYHDLTTIYNNPEQIDKDIKVFFEEHGFNGFTTGVLCRWFDFDKVDYKDIGDDPNPDPRTFEALELLITKVHAASGVVQIWAWGDEQRKMTPLKWGLNKKVDRRLQRYICARLGPLPGWAMCYGFDLQEWVGEKGLREWHKYMQNHFGWKHYLGGRSPDLEQIYDGLDYSSYQQWRPTYEIYVEGIEKRHPGKPSFFEDRFRVRDDPQYKDKDYDLDMTRRGLWHSTMAGGAANIWGHLHNRPKGTSCSGPYPNKHQIKTYSLFWKNRFKKEMVRDNAITDGVCLKVPDKLYVFYKEDTNSIKMDLAGMDGAKKAVAVDAKKEYKEIPLGTLKPVSDNVFSALYVSDWAVAVGD